MQWESGRTRQNLLHSVRESKGKRQTTSGVLSTACPSIFCIHRTRPIRSAKLPQVGLELTTLRLTAVYSDREAEFQISRPTSVSQSYRHPHAWNSSVRFIGDCAAWELVTLGVP